MLVSKPYLWLSSDPLLSCSAQSTALHFWQVGLVMLVSKSREGEAEGRKEGVTEGRKEGVTEARIAREGGIGGAEVVERQ